MTEIDDDNDDDYDNYKPRPCILGGWPLCVEWVSFVAKIAPQDSF